MKWTELTDSPRDSLCQALSHELAESGFANEYVSTPLPGELETLTAENFAPFLAEVKNNFGQIRIGGNLRTRLDLFGETFPHNVLSVGVIDALIPEGDNWWPRCQMVEGFSVFLAREVKTLNLAAGALIFGAGAEARVCAAAFVQVGFNKITFSESDDEILDSLVAEVSRKYFGVQFDCVNLNVVTQLPNVYSLAVYTLPNMTDKNVQTNLEYFNFLKSDGVWLDTSLSKDTTLLAEARTLKFRAWSGSVLTPIIDQVWCKDVFGVNINIARYTKSIDSI